MDRDEIEEGGRRDQDRDRVANVGVDDEEEFASLDDVGTPPAENPPVDDV